MKMQIYPEQYRFAFPFHVSGIYFMLLKGSRNSHQTVEPKIGLTTMRMRPYFGGTSPLSQSPIHRAPWKAIKSSFLPPHPVCPFAELKKRMSGKERRRKELAGQTKNSHQRVYTWSRKLPSDFIKN
jgi:hypothetical protein